MKNFIINILCILAFCTMVSCGFFDGSKPFITGALEGTWNWERTTGGVLGINIDADSVDYTQRLVIFDNAKAYMYKNGEVIIDYTIRYKEPEWLGEDGSTWIFYPGAIHSKMPFFVHKRSLNEGKLVLKNACIDCYTLYFSRQ